MTLTDSKKRRIENQAGETSQYSPQNLMSRMSHQKSVEFIHEMATKYKEVYDDLQSFFDNDPEQKKLFVRSLSYDTTDEALGAVMSEFGELEECVVVRQTKSEKSKGYAFVTYKYQQSANKAIEAKSVPVNGRDAFIHFASERNLRANNRNASYGPYTNGSSEDAVDEDCKLFVHGLKWTTTSEVLHDAFIQYGEIQNAAVTYDKQTKQSKGYGFVTFCCPESARKALQQPPKTIDNRTIRCHYASERQRSSMKNYGNVVSGTFVSQPNSGVPYNGTAFSIYPSSAAGYQSNEVPVFSNQISHLNQYELQAQLQSLRIAQEQLTNKLIQQQYVSVNNNSSSNPMEGQQQQPPFFSSAIAHNRINPKMNF